MVSIMEHGDVVLTAQPLEKIQQRTRPFREFDPV